MKPYAERLYNGIVKENPVFVLMLGMCPTLAVTTSAINGLGMGLSSLVVLAISNLVISLLRNIIPDDVRLPAFIVIVASFVTVVELLMEAYLPSLYSALGIYIPLIVVNCIILGRAEGFASKNSIGASALDGIFQGIGYTWVLLAMCIIREFLGKGAFGGGVLGANGVQIFPSDFGVGMLTLPVGGFLVLAALIAAMQWALARPKKDKEESK